MSKIVYLDNSATTVVCEEAAKKAYYIMTEKYGNPSSLHTLGFEAAKELEAEMLLQVLSAFRQQRFSLPQVEQRAIIQLFLEQLMHLNAEETESLQRQ